jgi:hypothetical protein
MAHCSDFQQLSNVLIVADALKDVTQKTETIQKLGQRIEETVEETTAMGIF